MEGSSRLDSRVVYLLSSAEAPKCSGVTSDLADPALGWRLHTLLGAASRSPGSGHTGPVSTASLDKGGPDLGLRPPLRETHTGWSGSCRGAGLLHPQGRSNRRPRGPAGLCGRHSALTSHHHFSKVNRALPAWFPTYNGLLRSQKSISGGCRAFRHH